MVLPKRGRRPIGKGSMPAFLALCGLSIMAFVLFVMDQTAKPSQPAPAAPVANENVTEKRAPVKKSVATASEEKVINAQLAHCFLPKAQFGAYSSLDGGKSAAKLIEDCPDEYFNWKDQCESDGTSSHDCFVQGMVLAQIAIKQFGK